MAFPDIAIPAQSPTLNFNVDTSYAMPADGSPLIVAIDVPDWTWTPLSWFPPRRTIRITTNFLSNTGVYGPNPTVISGGFGVVVGPGPGKFASYYVIKCVLYPKRHYIVVRGSTSNGTVNILIT